MVNLRNLGRSRRITAALWRRAASKYASRLGTFVGTAGVVGLAADTVATVVRGTKRASEVVTPATEPRSKKRLRFEAEMPDAEMQTVIKDPNTGGYSQKKRVKSRAGNRIDNQSKKMKLLGAKMQSFIDRFQAAADQIYIHSGAEAFPGYWPLDYYQDNNPPIDPVVYFPYYLMELNNSRQNNANGQAQMYGCPMMRLIRGNALNGTFSFSPVAGRANDDDDTVFGWLVERAPTVGEYRDGDSNFYDKFDIRMQLYGARKSAVRLRVDVIQFVNDDYAPPVFASTDGVLLPNAIRNDPGTLTSEETEKWNNFWISEVDRLVGNPIAKRGVKLSGGTYDILYSKIFDFEPVMTTEGDEAPHNVQFEFTYDYNKVVSYVESAATGLQIDPDEMIKPNEWDVSRANHVSVSCADKGRLFLRITGETPANATAYPEGTKIADWAGSFDMIVRRYSSRLHL